MLRNSYKEKYINALLFFTRRVQFPSRVKLFKLLFFLDERHIRERGLPVTDFDYEAWSYGPVPADLYHGLKDEIPPELADHLRVRRIKTGDQHDAFVYSARHDFDSSAFTPRQLRIMNELVEIYRDVPPSQMSEATHERGSPWDRTIKEKGESEIIDPAMMLDKDSPYSAEQVRQNIEERREMLENYSGIDRAGSESE